MSLFVLSFAPITPPDGSRRAVRICRVTRVLPDAMNKGLWIKSMLRVRMLVRAHRFGTMIKEPKLSVVWRIKLASKANPAALRGKHRDGILHKAVRNRPLCPSQKRFSKRIPKQRFGVAKCFDTMQRLFGLC